MKKALAILGLIVATAMPSWAAGEEASPDSKALEKKLLTRIERLQTQCTVIENMIGTDKPYTGLADKPVQNTLTALKNSSTENDAKFYAAITDCHEMNPTLDFNALTLEDLLNKQKDNMNAIAAFIESMGVNTDVKKETQAERRAAAAQAIEDGPNQEDLFREDLFDKPERANLLLLYLNRSNLGEFATAQAGKYNLGWGELIKDERLKAIFSIASREYKSDEQYLWFCLLDILSENIPGVNNDSFDGDNSVIKQLGYQDTWAINGHFQGTHNKKTPDAIRAYGFNREGSRLGVGRDITNILSRVAKILTNWDFI